MAKIIELNFAYFKELFFGNTIKKIRKWKIQHYKQKKVKSEAKSPERLYHFKFKIAMRDKNGVQTCDNDVFEISIPANGYFYAKKKLERFVVRNIDIEVIDFNSVEIPDNEEAGDEEEHYKTHSDEDRD